MKTKLLTSLRDNSRRKIGIFKNDDGTYRIVYDTNRYLYNVSDYDIHNDNSIGCWQILSDGIESLQVAKKLCDEYRRRWILGKVNEIRFNNSNRFY